MIKRAVPQIKYIFHRLVSLRLMPHTGSAPM